MLTLTWVVWVVSRDLAISELKGSRLERLPFFMCQLLLNLPL